MKTRLMILFASLFMANQVFARVIEVRSGEHDTFSRIVLSIPADTKWTLTQAGKKAELSLDLPDIQFDTSQVFRRIPTTRLRALFQQQAGETLQMSIGCECKVKGFTQSGTLLVIDIQDAVKSFDSPLPTLNTSSILRFGTVARMELHSPTLRWNLNPEVAEANSDPVLFETPDGATTNDLFTQETLENVNASELRLLSQIDRAAAQGLLLRNMHVSKPENSIVTTQIGGNDAQKNTAKIEPPLQVSMTTITSVDRELAGNNRRDLQYEDHISCIPADLVALPKWGNDLPFGAQIGSRRSHLFGEFDNVDQQAVVALARNLLFFGFGAEARKTLDLVTEENSTSQVLIAIAEILDNGRILSLNPFLKQLGCDSDVALWAYLADTDASASRKPNTDAVLTAFARLPEHLRVLLGPVLINKFSDSRDIESMEIVSRTANRTLKKSDPALDLAQANADLHHKDPRASADQMTVIALSGTEYSPQALIDLINTQTLADETVSPDIPSLIAAYKSEFRKSDLATDLHRAHVLSLALTVQFPEAFKNYQGQYLDSPKPVDDKTLSQVMLLLVKRADNITFLRYSLAQIERAESNFSDGLQNLIAARLIELGFLEQASSLLTGNEGQENGDRRMMKAQIAMAKNLPHRALVELLGASDPLAQGLRTQAFLDIGDYENAGLSREADGSDAGRAFWHAGNWEAVSRQDDSQFLDAATLAKSLTATHPDTNDQDSLAYGQALAASSLATRADISNLLGLVRRDP